MFRIDAWSLAKAADPDKNEDTWRGNDTVIALADGATDKTGLTYPNGETGGRNLARIAVEVAMGTMENGYPLAGAVTAAIQKFYRSNHPDALTDPSKRASTTLVVARLEADDVVVTQIGDTDVRLTWIDGRVEVLTNGKLVDSENAATRSRFIKDELARFEAEIGREPNPEERTRIVNAGRGAILDRLKQQFVFQNNPDEETHGYGTLDGAEVPVVFSSGAPTGFVKVVRCAVSGLASVELVSDGFYGEFAAIPDVKAYAELHHTIHKTDPDKHERYLSTKANDDATVVIGRLT